jgi:hypothetical protein
MFAFPPNIPAEIKASAIIQHILEHGCPCGKCGQSKETKDKDNGDRIHPLFKRIAEGDAKGIKELLSISDNPKLILTSRVSLDLVPAKVKTSTKMVQMKFVTPMVAAIIVQNEDVLQALVDAAVELRIFAECTEGRDFVNEEEDTKKENYGGARPLWLALGKMWHKGAEILFKAGSPLFPPDDRMPYTTMVTFLSKGVLQHDDITTLSWMLKRGLPLFFGPADCRISIFCLAALNGANGCLMTILQEAFRRKQPSPLDVVDPAGKSPLVCAVYGGKIHTMLWLISQGAHKGLDGLLGDPQADEKASQILCDARQNYLDSLLDDALC